jgi:hypothetical protein
VVVGVAVVTLGEPSPKSHAYDVIVPYRTVDADASKAVACPASPGVTDSLATGA